jgi:hypothetical protein
MTKEQTVSVRRFRTGSVFRIAAAGIFFSIVPFFILMGVLALFGISSVKWNGAPVYGINGLLASPLMGLFAAALFTGFGGVGMAFGLWLYSKLKPLSLTFLVDAAEPDAANGVAGGQGAT